MMSAQRIFFASLISLVFSSTGFAQEQWREQARFSADRLASAIEVLDESLHEAYEDHSTPEFAIAIEDIHHIEDLVFTLSDEIPTASYAELCELFDHLYEDLVAIRLDLIDLGLESNPTVVQAWNSMVDIYNNELNPIFRNCRFGPHGRFSGAFNAGRQVGTL